MGLFNVSANHIAAFGPSLSPHGDFEPQRTNNFTLEFTAPEGVRTAWDNRMFALAVSEIPFPQEESEVLEVPMTNETRKAAGRTSFSDEQLTVLDFVGAETSNMIDSWRKLIYNPEDGVIGYAKDYKSTGELIYFGPDGNQPRRWILIGIWPKRVRYGQGNMTQGNTQNRIEVEFALDRMWYIGNKSSY